MLDHPFLSHFVELRKRLIVCVSATIIMFCVAFTFYDYIIALFLYPFSKISASFLSDKLVIHSLLEGFVIKMKFSFITGLLFSLPIIVYQALRFLFPGLKKKEKRLILMSLFSSIILTSFGFYIAYFFVVPFSLNFLTSAYFIPKNVDVLLNLQQNIFYVFNLIVFMILVFQFPIVLETCLYLNLVKRKLLLKASRYIVIFILIISAIFTPPDIVSQLLMAIPLTVLFFMTIAIAKIFKWGE